MLKANGLSETKPLHLDFVTMDPESFKSIKLQHFVVSGDQVVLQRPPWSASIWYAGCLDFKTCEDKMRLALSIGEVMSLVTFAIDVYTFNRFRSWLFNYLSRPPFNIYMAGGPCWPQPIIL